MKEIRLELDPRSVNRILMELDVLYKSTSEYIIKFYGAFFAESCVYYLMEIMDGSIDQFYGTGVPEDILGHIALAVRVLDAACLCATRSFADSNTSKIT